MIRLKISHLMHGADLWIPVEYETAAFALWTLGLDQDPVKYTLRELNAQFSCESQEEVQMLKLIDYDYTLQHAIECLSEMMFPPYPVSERICAKIAAGEYSSYDDFFTEMESLVYDRNLYQHIFYFPISGVVVNKQGVARQASDSLLSEYEHIICEAIRRIPRRISGSESKIMEDVEGVYQKLMRASWSACLMNGFLIGQVIFFLTEPLTVDEERRAEEKIQRLNSTFFYLHMKPWSVMTDEGLLFVNLCDEDGDYALFELCDDEDDEDLECICPECRARMSEGVKL